MASQFEKEQRWQLALLGLYIFGIPFAIIVVLGGALCLAIWWLT